MRSKEPLGLGDNCFCSWKVESFQEREERQRFEAELVGWLVVSALNTGAMHRCAFKVSHVMVNLQPGERAK